jgi:hypothetical protein
MNGDKMPDLGSIILNDTKVTDKGLITLIENGKRLSKLVWISLNNNGITDEGFKILC